MRPGGVEGALPALARVVITQDAVLEHREQLVGVALGTQFPGDIMSAANRRASANGCMRAAPTACPGCPAALRRRCAVGS